LYVVVFIPYILERQLLQDKDVKFILLQYFCFLAGASKAAVASFSDYEILIFARRLSSHFANILRNGEFDWRLAADDHCTRNLNNPAVWEKKLLRSSSFTELNHSTNESLTNPRHSHFYIEKLKLNKLMLCIVPKSEWFLLLCFVLCHTGLTLGENGTVLRFLF